MDKLKEINGKYYQECEVVMLATYKATNMFLSDDKTFISTMPKPVTSIGYGQHLYFISNEKIKEGNWYFDLDTKKICQWIMSHSIPSDFEQRVKRIIATTDTSLKIKTFYEIEGDQEVSLPQPSKEFIQAYIKAYNKGEKIEKVLVEYKKCYNQPVKENYEKFGDLWVSVELKPNSSNEITIKKIKDSYTKEDFINALHKVELSHNKDYSKLWNEIEENL